MKSFLSIVTLALFSCLSVAGQNFHNIQAIIMAAGRSTRMKTTKSKLLHSFCGQEVILYPLRAIASLSIPSILVVNYQKEEIMQTVKDNLFDSIFVHQKETLGTANAVAVTQEHWNAEHLLIINGDGPLVDEELLKGFIEHHIQTDATITFVTAWNTDPTITIARVFTSPEGFIDIVEHKAFTGDRTLPSLVNAGIYIMRRSFLEKHLEDIKPYAWGEVGLPELIKIAQDHEKLVETYQSPIDKIRGINTLNELSLAERIKRQEIVQDWMSKGVRFIDDQTTLVDLNIEIGPDSTIGAGVHLLGTTTIGHGCTIGSYSILDGCTIKNNTLLEPFSRCKNKSM